MLPCPTGTRTKHLVSSEVTKRPSLLMQLGPMNLPVRSLELRQSITYFSGNQRFPRILAVVEYASPTSCLLLGLTLGPTDRLKKRL